MLGTNRSRILFASINEHFDVKPVISCWVSWNKYTNYFLNFPASVISQEWCKKFCKILNVKNTKRSTHLKKHFMLCLCKRQKKRFIIWMSFIEEKQRKRNVSDLQCPTIANTLYLHESNTYSLCSIWYIQMIQGTSDIGPIKHSKHSHIIHITVYTNSAWHSTTGELSYTFQNIIKSTLILI